MVFAAATIVKRPLTGAMISCKASSIRISAIGSPAATIAPSAMNHRSTIDLADVRLRQIVAELDQSRHFVAGEFASAEIAHRLGIKRRIAAHDKSLDGFPAGRVRHTDYGAILHARKPGEHCFHLIGIDIEA